MAKSLDWHFTANDVNALHSKAADHRIFYGSSPLQFGDLRLPNKRGPYPVAIIIHGGCWLSKIANVQYTSALAEALRDSGIASWNIEYRREDDEGGGWPGTFEDIAHAADFLQKIGKEYSLDLTSIVAIGHSAGGHLALWLAARHQLLSSSQLYTKKPIKLQGAIILGGVPDLKSYREYGHQLCGTDVIGKLLGNSPTQISKHYKEASPIELLPLGIPQILIYGSDDNAVPMAFGREYTQAALKKGDVANFTVVENAGHHEYSVPNSITWATIKMAVFSLLGLEVKKEIENKQVLGK